MYTLVFIFYQKHNITINIPHLFIYLRIYRWQYVHLSFATLFATSLILFDRRSDGKNRSIGPVSVSRYMARLRATGADRPNVNLALENEVGEWGHLGAGSPYSPCQHIRLRFVFGCNNRTIPK